MTVVHRTVRRALFDPVAKRFDAVEIKLAGRRSTYLRVPDRLERFARRVPFRTSRQAHFGPPPLRDTPSVDHRTRRLVTPGNPVSEAWRHRLSLVLIIATGLDRDGVEAAVDGVARGQAMTAGFRPIFVSSVSDFAPFRTYGYTNEYLQPPENYDAAGLDAPWSRYRFGRLAELVDAYQPDAIVNLDSTLQVSDELRLRLR